MNLTPAQLRILRFAASRERRDPEVSGICPRRGQGPVFDRLVKLGLLTEDGWGVDADDHTRDVPLYQLTDLGRQVAS